MSVITNSRQVDTILDRGIIVNILPDKQTFRQKLLSGQQLRFYIGVDPTSTALHLSHAKNYMLLEEFRRLGHEVIVLFGDFTARIGDPSDRGAARQQLSTEAVTANVKTWLSQIQPLMAFEAKTNPPRVLYNSTWLKKLDFTEALDLAANFTVQQMIERDMFQRRLGAGQPIHLHEFLYPLMQGYDSVAMDVDVELCGTDQTFNALAGRTLQKRLHNKDKFVVAVNLLENPKTGELMSKSRGTGVFLGGSAAEMYGAVMAQPDEMIEPLLINNTRLPLNEIVNMDIGNQPRSAKARTALEIATIFYGRPAAEVAEAAFNQQFSEGKLPEDIPQQQLPKADWNVADLLVEIKLAPSKSEARRLLAQGGVKLNSQAVEAEQISIKSGDVLQAGKRRFVRLSLA